MAGLLARDSVYPADLVANFAHLSAPLLAAGAIWFCFFGRGWQAAAAAVLLAAHFPFLTVYQEGADAQEVRSAVPLKVVSYNVLEINEEREAVVDFLLGEDADLLLLLEVDRDWAGVLERLGTVYPHAIVSEREMKSDYEVGNFGIALFSKHPVAGEVVRLSDRGVPTIRAEVELGVERVSFLGLHLAAPLNEDAWNLNRTLVEEALARMPSEGAAIVAGDLNCSLTGSTFKAFREKGLVPSFAHSWRQPSLELYGAELIRIDHILVSRHFGRIGGETGPFLGSDHRPVIAELALNLDTLVVW